MSLLNENTVSDANPSPIFKSITLRMPMLAFHPYNNRKILDKHSHKYKELIPKNLNSNYAHECMTMSLKLNRISDVYDDNVFIQVYDKVKDSSFIRRLERFIIEGKFSNQTKFIEKYLIYLATKELYLKTNKNYLNWFPESLKNFLHEYRHRPAFAYIYYIIQQCSLLDPFVRPIDWYIPKDYICVCSQVWSSHQEARYDFSDEEYDLKEEVEITGLISSISNFGKAIGSSAASSYYALKAGNYDVSQVTNEFTADLMLLIANFNIYTITWAFVKLLNRLFNIPNLFNIIVETFKYCYDSIKNYISTSDQPNLEEFESTAFESETLIIPPNLSETWFENFFKNLKESGPVLCSIMATLLVISTGVFMGSQVFNDRSMITKCRAKRVAEAFHTVSKTGVSVQKLYQILSAWPKWVYEMAYDYIIGQDQTPLEEMLSLADVRDLDDTPRRDFFKEVEYLSNPVNIISIGRNPQLRNKLAWCNSILTDMSYQIANKPTTEVKPHISQWVYSRLQYIRQAMMSVCRMPCNYSQRFVPFWVNIIGASGLGKTTLVPDILKRMKEVLIRCEDHKDVIPIEDRDWVYCINFCSKYMTGYSGQYSVLIDDLFQDATTVGDATPSPLLLIQMVSSQPFTTIQASINDKGIDFTSKIIFSTSNDFNIQRKEIVDATALTRRMNVRIHARRAYSNEPKDALLEAIGHHENIVFDIYTSDGYNKLRTLNYEDLITYLLDRYITWYKLQDKLLTRNQGTVDVDAIIRKLEEGAELTSVGKIKTPNYKCNKIKVKAEVHSSSDSQSEIFPMNLLPTESGSTTPLSSLNCSTCNSIVTPPTTSSTELESCRSYYCTLFGVGNITTIPMFVNCTNGDQVEINIQQFDCDCDTCVGFNRLFREHRRYLFGTMTDIVSIREFRTISQSFSNSNDVSQDHIHRSNTRWQQLQDILKNIASHPLTIIITAISAITSVWYFTHKNTLNSTALQYSSGSNKITKPKLKIKDLKPIKFQATNSTTYSEFDEELRCAMPNQNTYDLVYNKIVKRDAMCILRFIDKNNKVLANSALRVVGTCILTNNHFFSRLKQGDEFEVILHNRHTGMSIKKQIFNPFRYAQLGDIDACIYKCDNKLPHASSLIEHFVNNEIPNKTHNGLAVTIYDPTQLMCPVLIPNVIAKPYLKAGYYENQSYNILDTYTTNLDVIQGQSGSLLISTEPSSQNRILGILVCRSKFNNKGYFKPVTQNSINEAIKYLKVDENLSINFEEDIEITSAKATLLNVDFKHESLNYLGKIPQSKQVTQAIQTKFVPSVLQDPQELAFQPAVLHPYDQRLKPELRGKPIIYRSIQGFDEPIGAIDTQELDIAADELSLEYLSWNLPPGFSKRLLDDYQTINGIKPYLKKLDMRTSPGYPYVKEKSATDLGKYKWFNEIEPRYEQDGKVFEMKDNLCAIVGLREARARQGYKMPTIAYMCLKDELRPNEKITEGQTRVFTCLPMDYNILIRKYFGAFIIAQHHNAGVISSCVGVNPAKDWATMWQRLLSLNDEWEDFDYKNWDQHLHPELLMKVADIINEWYRDEFNSDTARVRRVLLHDLVHTTIMVKDFLFCKSSGQCSGCAITAELNCIIHDLLMYYVFRMLCKQRKYKCDLTIYRERVQTIMYGDDIVKSTPKGYFFTGDNIKPILDKLGMHITPGDKKSTEFITKPPDQILFLKRSFTLDPDSKTKNVEQHTVRAPLRKDIITNIYQWVRKSEDPIEAVRENCETALREMFMYGKQEFDKQRSIINAKIDQFNQSNCNLQQIKPLTINYNNLLADFDNCRLDLIGFEPNSLDDGFID